MIDNKELCCEVCYDAYNTNDNQPLLIPACGHTFCKSCVGTILKNEGEFRCPKCKQYSYDSEISSYPKNFDLLKIIE